VSSRLGGGRHGADGRGGEQRTLRTAPSPIEPMLSPNPEALIRSKSMCSLGTTAPTRTSTPQSA
jgi:hypothetical protein